jgi:hypothetical protein
MVAAIDHSSIVEGMRAIGTTQAGLISKNNLKVNLVLNVQSIAENPQKLPSFTIDSILIYLTKVRRLSYYTILIIKGCYDYFFTFRLKPFKIVRKTNSTNVITTIFDEKNAFYYLRIVTEIWADLTNYTICAMQGAIGNNGIKIFNRRCRRINAD